ncbi:DUF2827 family protein [Paraburkholderia caballeronis]|uniref:DUF2827 domain-containing protein n=1 Tax=Paraburkholderia caballeronis TaxID=416943 RepID=A0A1H7SAW5_9BURK|nr:DUF2827 family protein [Paraburkholderia caballeronis]PXW22981.1 uncharacterized protein DUF2827 [Paraburkholderia caballeronis]PXW97366.1 uncharacterized protein DUF2827 [Paraburkholderia caballeronis]RAJ93886.1 uncharacterized protein DUF2827 [Paraburkholderia caballeronis]TDV13847.1 uncharacterized protein DUF2827 [Paraburkholderia caballeronis]TDV15361.1 uncharacterized protein DUF2827 [Paraburkholderia caballeronis]
MRIGLSVRSRGGLSIEQDGASQYAIFVAGAFLRLPFVRSVVLIDGDHGVRPPQAADAIAPGLRVVTQQQATDEVNVIVRVGGALEPAWLDLMHARGCKIVCCRSRLPLAGLAEPAALDAPADAPQPDRCDEVWLLPKDRLTVPLLRTLYPCPVHVVPFVWSPAFVDARIAELARDGVAYGYGASRGVRDTGGGLRVAVLEARFPAVKTASVAMLVCDRAYRADRGAVGAMHVLDARHLNEPPTMLHLANAFDVVRDRRAIFDGPHDIAAFVGRHADAVVAHQPDDDQNYGYLDVLYGGYPLIHNAPWLMDAGYYYPGADAQRGARQLLAAAHRHDASLDAYRVKSRRVFNAVDPLSHANLAAYALRLKALGVGRGG